MNALVDFIIELFKSLVGRILVALEFQFWWRPFSLGLAKFRRMNFNTILASGCATYALSWGLFSFTALHVHLGVEFASDCVDHHLRVLVLFFGLSINFRQIGLFFVFHVCRPVTGVYCLSIHWVVTTPVFLLATSYLFRLPLRLLLLCRRLDSNVS